MQRVGPRLLSLACLLGSAARIAAEPAKFTPCDDLPGTVAVLGQKSEVEAFGIAPSAMVAMAAIASHGDGGRSALRFAVSEDKPREVRLAGRVSGLAVMPDGTFAYAIVRQVDRKGLVRSVDLWRVDVGSGRATLGATLPVTAGGLALGDGGSTLLVASRDEIRTFVLPGLASGPLYRALGENVGVAPVPGSSFVLVAQPSRIVLADLAAPQNRDGLALSEEAAAPAPLRGMLTSTGEQGPIALSPGGQAWCVLGGSLPLPPSPVRNPPPADAVPPAEPPTTPDLVVPPPVAVEPSPPLASEPGTVSGTVAGPSVAEVSALVLLGPDNVLHEAARAVPDERGRYSVSAVPSGSYRIVAAGKGGRVLICEPPFITIQVGGNGAVEAPVLKVVRAQ